MATFLELIREAAKKVFFSGAAYNLDADPCNLVQDPDPYNEYTHLYNLDPGSHNLNPDLYPVRSRSGYDLDYENKFNLTI